MKELLKNIWEGPATSFAAAAVGALAVVSDSEVVPVPARIAMGALSAFLFLYGPNKPKLQ